MTIPYHIKLAQNLLSFHPLLSTCVAADSLLKNHFHESDWAELTVGFLIDIKKVLSVTVCPRVILNIYKIAKSLMM